MLVACTSGAPRDRLRGGGASVCELDADCVLAATSCCECPTFAVAISDPAHDGCNGIACPGPYTCPNSVRAVCDAGTCALACAPQACNLVCADGYAIDRAGCAACACANVTDRACLADSDCTRTRADCCGCARGGEDTAVPADDAAAFDAALGCPADPTCPAANTCAPDLAPRCIEGACQLVPPLPAGACGRSDLPGCPIGQLCTIDVDGDATAYGVGVCM